MAYDPWVKTQTKTKPPVVVAPAAPVAPLPPPGEPGPGVPGSGSFDAFSNPYYQQALAGVNAAGAADAANTRAAIQQALVAFGFVPGGFKDKLGALDATTRALIQKNTDTGISGYARLLEGREEGIKDIVRRLQGRGLRRSGAKGALLKKNQLGYDRNFADAVANLLGGVNSQYGQYAQNEYARQQNLQDALRWVYQNYYTPSGGSSGLGGSGGGWTPNFMGSPMSRSVYDQLQAFDNSSFTPRENYSGGIGGTYGVV